MSEQWERYAKSATRDSFAMLIAGDPTEEEVARWLAAHDAEVLRAAAVELEDSIHHLDPAHPSELSFINCTRIDAKLLRERAERTEARACVVAEEPEWAIEYGVRGDVDSPMSSREAAEHAIERMAKAPRGYRITRTLVERRVSPWVSVKQEGQR